MKTSSYRSICLASGSRPLNNWSQWFVRSAFFMANFFKYFVRKNWELEVNYWIVIEKWYNRWLRLLTMLFPGRIYIALAPWHFGDFCKILLPNIAESQRKSYDLSTGPLAGEPAEPSQLTATNWPRSNDFVTWFRHWFRRSDFVAKWGFGHDGSGDSKNIFRIAVLSQSALFAVSWFAVSLLRSVVVTP